MEIQTYILSLPCEDVVGLSAYPVTVTACKDTTTLATGQTILISRSSVSAEKCTAILAQPAWDHNDDHKSIALSLKQLIASNHQNIKETARGINQEIVSEYLGKASALEEELKQEFPDICVLCSTLLFDFCFLLPSDDSTQTERLIARLKKRLPAPTNKYPRTEKSEKTLKRILQQYSDRTFPFDSRHIDQYNACILELINRSPSNPDLQSDIDMFATFLLKKCQEETNYRWIFDSGDICIEDAAFFNEFEKEFQKYISYAKQYIQQSDERNPFANWSWALYHITQILSQELIQKRWAAEKEKTSLDFQEWRNEDKLKKNFCGLFPILDDNANHSIDSQYPMHYSDEFCHGFLRVSPEMLNRIEQFLPAYIHELFHYIPPLSRRDRNDAKVTLVVHTILIFLRKELFGHLMPLLEGRENAHGICTNIYGCYVTHLKKHFDQSINIENAPLNTMNMELFMPEAIYTLTSEQFFEMLLKTDISGSLDSSLDDDIKRSILQAVTTLMNSDSFQSNCQFIWKYEADSYITTFNSVLRELRSDISMCQLLDISLSEYFLLMANELDWAERDTSSAADSTMIRVGLLSRLLYQREIGSTALFPIGEKQTEEWKKYCEAALNELIQCTKKDKVKTHLEHIKKYIDSYVEISVEQADRQYTKKGESFLEQTLKYLIEGWQKEITLYAEIPQIRYLKAIYKENSDGTKPEWIFGFKILFRDYYNHFTDQNRFY